MRVSEFDSRVYLANDRWRKVTDDCGFVFDCRERGDEQWLRAQGRWALDPLVRGDSAQYARLERYLADYFAKDEGQLLRVKPTAKAHTLTTGHFRG